MKFPGAKVLRAKANNPTDKTSKSLLKLINLILNMCNKKTKVNTTIATLVPDDKTVKVRKRK